MEGKNLRDFFCEKCSMQFGNKFVYDLHMKLVHDDRKIKTVSDNQEKRIEMKDENGVIDQEHHTANSNKESVVKNNPNRNDKYKCHL